MSATRKSSSRTGTSAGIPSAAQISENLATALSAADSAAAQSVQALTLVHQARFTQLSRTAVNLKAQFGANDAGVKAAEAAAATAASTAARVSIVQQEINTPAPQAPAKGFLVDGRVYDSNFQPLAGMTVFLVDANNTYLQQFGFGYTDDSGYFQIVVSDGGDQIPNAEQIFLEVADSKSRPVYLSPTPVQPSTGNALYQKIVIPAGGKPIGDPPKAVRATAVPSKKQKS